ncbi:MAG: MliC family protein [Rhodospirillales bacterium]|nr:MliC family protein [Rhodospirillales bacterium]MBO6787657.1 MliC family protein [Rhodospirillales bacterium]
MTASLFAGGGPATDYIYECDGTAPVVARFLDGEVKLRIGVREVVLPQGRSGSGARYTDGKMVFWIKGRNATFDTGDGSQRKCRVTDRG